jgi:hypothetical protein
MRLLTPFLPGEKVPASGQYWVIHLRHRPPYKALLSAGERFPVCKQCDTSVVFEYASDIVTQGFSLGADADFAAAKRGVWNL